MQNCPLDTTGIASVIVFNARKHKIYGTSTQISPEGSQYPPGPLAKRALILRMNTFVTKLNLYPKNRHC